MCNELGVETGIDLPRLLDVAREAEKIFGHPLPGKVMRGGHLASYREQGGGSACGSRRSDAAIEKSTQREFDRYRGMAGKPLVAGHAARARHAAPLRAGDHGHRSAVPRPGLRGRRRSSAARWRRRCTRCTRFGRSSGGPDPLDVLRSDPDADGSGGNDGMYFGLTPIDSPFKRLLNGGNEIEFFRCLAHRRTLCRQRTLCRRPPQGRQGRHAAPGRGRNHVFDGWRASACSSTGRR